MAEILDLKRWQKVDYRITDSISISMKLKRLRRHEARPLQKLLSKLFLKMEEARKPSLTTAEQHEILQQVYDAMPEEELKKYFDGCLREVTGLLVDGEAITAGAALFDEADDALVLFVLLNLFRLSRLTVAEGNASASLSTSSPQSEAPASSLAAEPIELEAGPPPSTATAILAVPVSSSEPVEA